LRRRVLDYLDDKGPAPDEYIDLLLCRDVYHCLPSQLDEEDHLVISSHLTMMDAEAEHRLPPKKRQALEHERRMERLIEKEKAKRRRN
jgi:hypothetical protein